MTFPACITDSLSLAHPGWRPVLEEGIRAVISADPRYLPDLEKEPFLPTRNRLFAAFSQPPDEVRYILVGEGPYPREESATGYCFMDGAVHDIWSEKGFSRQVNRATSLRNFLKMLLVAEKTLLPDHTGEKAMAEIARVKPGSDFPYISSMSALQQALLDQGFLLLNATLVFRRHVSPLRESKAWQPFLRAILDALAARAAKRDTPPPVLILWGKAAEKLARIESVSRFPQVRSEHPYNLSFIKNREMQNLFGPMNILKNSIENK